MLRNDFTNHFIQYMLSADGFVKRNVLSFADSLIKKKHKDNKYFEAKRRPYAS